MYLNANWKRIWKTMDCYLVSSFHIGPAIIWGRATNKSMIIFSRQKSLALMQQSAELSQVVYQYLNSCSPIQPVLSTPAHQLFNNRGSPLSYTPEQTLLWTRHLVLLHAKTLGAACKHGSWTVNITNPTHGRRARENWVINLWGLKKIHRYLM